ncbi:MAG: hypothetical protein ACRESO_06000 [Gammaproteobacteria bacterium]
MNSNVMKTLIAIAALTLLLAGCASMGGGSSGIESLASGQHSNIKDQQYTDIHNQADFDALWQKAFANMPSAPTKPVLDFSKQMVIASFIGHEDHGGYLVRVMKVDDSGPTLNVTVMVTVPGANCRHTLSPTDTYNLSAIPASTKQVNFDPQQQNAPACGG